MFNRLFCLTALIAAGAAAPAFAATCQGKTPAVGATVEGTVLHVEDGQRLCLANGPTPDAWTEVQALTIDERVADAQVAKASLMNAAFSKKMSCVVTGVVDGRAVARCTVDKQPLARVVSQADPVQVAQWMSAQTSNIRLASAN